MEKKMKKIITIILVTTFLYSVPSTVIYNIEGMTCPSGCAPKVTNAALQIKGVEKCDVNFDESKATIIYDNEKVKETEILAGLKTNTTFKYNLNPKEDKESKANCTQKQCCKKTVDNPKKSFFQRIFGL